MPILGRGDCTCLWYEQTCCLAWNDPPKPVGVIKEDDYTCKFGLGVCTSGLKKNYDMKDLFSLGCQIFVCKETCQIPFGNKRTPCFAPHVSLCHRPSVTQFILSDCPCARRPSVHVRLLLHRLLSGTGLRGSPAGLGRWRPPRGHRDGPLSSLTAHRRAEVPTTMVFFLKDVTRTPCASACEGRVGKDLVTLLRLDAHAAARRYDMPCSPEPAPGACVIAVRHRASAAPASDKSHCIHGHPGCHVASAVLVRWGIKHNLGRMKV